MCCGMFSAQRDPGLSGASSETRSTWLRPRSSLLCGLEVWWGQGPPMGVAEQTGPCPGPRSSPVSCDEEGVGNRRGFRGARGPRSLGTWPDGSATPWVPSVCRNGALSVMAPRGSWAPWDVSLPSLCGRVLRPGCVVGPLGSRCRFGHQAEMELPTCDRLQGSLPGSSPGASSVAPPSSEPSLGRLWEHRASVALPGEELCAWAWVWAVSCTDIACPGLSALRPTGDRGMTLVVSAGVGQADTEKWGPALGHRG